MLRTYYMPGPRQVREIQWGWHQNRQPWEPTACQGDVNEIITQMSGSFQLRRRNPEPQILPFLPGKSGQGATQASVCLCTNWLGLERPDEGGICGHLKSGEGKGGFLCPLLAIALKSNTTHSMAGGWWRLTHLGIRVQGYQAPS